MSDEEFGDERLEALLNRTSTTTPRCIRDQIADMVDSFVGAAPQKDERLRMRA